MRWSVVALTLGLAAGAALPRLAGASARLGAQALRPVRHSVQPRALQVVPDCTSDEALRLEAGGFVCVPKDCVVLHGAGFVFDPSTRTCIDPTAVPSPTPSPSAGASAGPGGATSGPASSGPDCSGHGSVICIAPSDSDGSLTPEQVQALTVCTCECEEGWASRSGGAMNASSPLCSVRSTAYDAGGGEGSAAGSVQDGCEGDALCSAWASAEYILALLGILALVTCISCCCCWERLPAPVKVCVGKALLAPCARCRPATPTQVSLPNAATAGDEAAKPAQTPSHAPATRRRSTLVALVAALQSQVESLQSQLAPPPVLSSQQRRATMTSANPLWKGGGESDVTQTPTAGAVTWDESGQYWWDGEAWVYAGEVTWDESGYYWWDAGQEAWVDGTQALPRRAV